MGTDAGLRGWFVRVPRDLGVLALGVSTTGVRLCLMELYLVLNFYHTKHLKSHPKHLGNDWK